MQEKENVIHIAARLSASDLKQLEDRRDRQGKASASAAASAAAFVFCLMGAISLFYKYRFPGLFSYPGLLYGLSALLSLFLVFYYLRIAEDSPEEETEPEHIRLLLLLGSELPLSNFLCSLLSCLTMDGPGVWPGSVFIVTAAALAALYPSVFGNRKKCRPSAAAVLLLSAALLLPLSTALSCCVSEGQELPQAISGSACAVRILLADALAAGLLVLLSYRPVQKHSSEKKQRTIGPLRRQLTSERGRQFFCLLLNAGIFLICVRGLTGLFLGDPLTRLSIPAMVTFVLTLLSLVSAVLNILCIRTNNTGVYPGWYRYASLVRTAGAFQNFITGLASAAADGGGIWSLFTAPRWNQPAAVYVLCPLLALLIFLIETKEIDRKLCLLSLLPYQIYLLATVLMIRIAGNEDQLGFEIKTFYAGPGFLVSLAVQFSVGLVIYIIGLAYLGNIRFRLPENTVIRDSDRMVQMTVCGTRRGFTPSSPLYYRYGQASRCAVVRDGSYGMMFDCGSGLVFAPEDLKGCSRVDIFLSDISFQAVMGFLAVPNPCPGASIRIFGPFGRGRNFVDMNGFAMEPFWPVSMIVGECVSVMPDRDVRLNDTYTVRFTPADPSGSHYLIRVDGTVRISYTGVLAPEESLPAGWAKDSDLLICGGPKRAEDEALYALAENTGFMLVSCHGPSECDTLLDSREKNIQKLDMRSAYAKQGTRLCIG